MNILAFMEGLEVALETSNKIQIMHVLLVLVTLPKDMSIEN